MKFIDLSLNAPILDAITQKGYETATPIQAQTIPHTLEGRDVLGCAQTGTGKTAAFALPILHRLAESEIPWIEVAQRRTRKGNKRPNRRRPVRSLVLAPTRELAEQIFDSFRDYGQNLDIYGTVLCGGVSQNPQVRQLEKGVDFLVATPGRLIDLINQELCDITHVNSFVLDEADRMLDMGFMPDIKRIVSYLPKKKQTLLFSATMPKEIRQFAESLLNEPAEITIKAESLAVERIKQMVYHVDQKDKLSLLSRLVDTLSISQGIIFTRTKYKADRVARHLKKEGFSAEAIHGDKSQFARRKTLDRFREGKAHFLVATDIAARGIDVDGISHVFNFDMSRDTENHVHRIGRTARAGAEGTAISFCDREEKQYLKAIEKLIDMKIKVAGDLPPNTKKSKKTDHPMAKEGGEGKKKRQGGGQGGHGGQRAEGQGGGAGARKKKKFGGKKKVKGAVNPNETHGEKKKSGFKGKGKAKGKPGAGASAAGRGSASKGHNGGSQQSQGQNQGQGSSHGSKQGSSQGSNQGQGPSKKKKGHRKGPSSRGHRPGGGGMQGAAAQG